MTTHNIEYLSNGDVKETRTNVGCEPLVWINGVLQPSVSKKTVAWEEWFSWRPVKDIHGKWHWLETIYRKVSNTYVDHDDWTRYYYGTIFDILENE